MRERGLRAVAIRHPMPYRDLQEARVQRFATRGDLSAGRCTVEEREEYEPHIDAGTVVYAGVDYAEIVRQAEREADLLIWDGGNNDFPFLRPDLHIALVDALRPDDVDTYHPGEAVARMADVLVVNKVSAALPSAIEHVEAVARRLNPKATLLQADSPIRLDPPDGARGKRVIVVEDGPTLTHGGMRYGAGYMAAIAGGAREIIDPRPSAAPRLAEVFRDFPHLTKVLPAMGYDDEQIADLRETITTSSAEAVVTGSPVDLAHLLRLRIPVVRARYEYEDREDPGLGGIVDAFLDNRVRPGGGDPRPDRPGGASIPVA